MVGVGESRIHRSWDAGRSAAAQALERIGGRLPSIVLVFANAGYDQEELIAGVRSVTGSVPLSGCSGSGVITQSGSDERSRAVAVMAIASETIAFDPFLVRGLSRDPEGCGRKLAARVVERGRPDARLLLVFPDGVTGNSTALLRGIEAGVSSPLAIVGGAAGEFHRFERTYQYHDGEVASDAVAAVLLSGAFTHEILVSHGCDLLGVEHVVTRAEGGTVHEIDGRPAWSVLREYLDEPGEELDAANVPYLCVAQPLGSGDFVVRVPLGLDRASGALFFPGELRTGDRVIMARRDVDDICAHALESARELMRRRKEPPSLVLQFDCAGRGRLLLGEGVTPKLIDPVQRIVGKHVPWIGFHSYGEIAPRGARAYYHNYTMVLCALYGR